MIGASAKFVSESESRDHVVYEIGVARNVDDSDFLFFIIRTREREVGEAELNGDSAFLFLGKSIRVRARQSLNE